METAAMIASDARAAANRRNAAKSTGPKTPEGKARSRANALKHGLCSSVVVAEDLDLVQRRATDYFQALKPQNQYHAWIVDQVAILSIRIDRCERIERRVRDKVSLRAELTWDDDRRLEAEILGGLLPNRPAETVETLKRTPHGCEWLMTRWALLAHAADTAGHWTEDQAKLAYDLLATPLPFRLGQTPGTSIDFDGRVLDPSVELASIARRELALLKEQREAVAGLDEVERALAECDLTNDADPELRRLRRYELTLHRRMRWCLSQLQQVSPHTAPFPGLRPEWSQGPQPTPKMEPPTPAEVAAANQSPMDIHPPFDLEPDEAPEPGQKADIPKILLNRKQKRLARAEGRREARRRKVERLRA